jgi:NADH dehydrogenase
VRIERILVLGATGLIGAPVARQLLADGHHVRVLVRDPDRARTQLGAELEYVSGSVTDSKAVDRAVRGIDGVHVSLGVEDPAQLDTVEYHGTASVAAAAARHGVQRISYLTGSLVREEYGPKIPEHRAKLAAEQAIQESGVPYTFFRPTYFTNTLARHVQGPLLVALGRQRRTLHPVCAEDFAVQVSHAFATPAAANRDFYIHGPEQLTLHQALDTYHRIVAPDKRLVTIPLPVMATIDRLFMGGELAPNLQIMRLLARLGERGDPTAATDLLGAPTTTVQTWCHTQATTADANDSTHRPSP